MNARNKLLTPVLALAFVACADGVPSPSAPDALPVAYAKGGVPGGPGGGGGDGDGGGGGTVASFDDGLVGAAQSVVVSKDNRVALTLGASAYMLSSAMDATQALADSDQTAMAVCTWEIPEGAESLKADLVAALADPTASSRSLEAQVDKRAALKEVESSDNYITVRADGDSASPTIFIGRNNAGTGNFLVVTFAGSDINDANSTRVFTASKGTVRVVKRFDADGDGVAEADEPIASVRCPNQDTVVLTVAPAA